MALYNEIEPLDYGLSANDGKGFDLRTSEMITDSNFRNIILFLTGGLRETGRIDNVQLPIAKGGTGASSVTGILKNLGMVIGPNGEMLSGLGAVGIYDGKYTVHGKSSNHFAFSKVSLGFYKLEGGIIWDPKGYKVVYPKDEFGNVLCGCVITPAVSGIDIKVHPVALQYDVATESIKFILTLTTLIDIPANRHILLNLLLE